MAAFATLVAAENRAKAKSSGTGDNTWVEAYACRNISGTIGVRVLRYANTAAGLGAEASPSTKPGAWDFLTDDAAV